MDGVEAAGSSSCNEREQDLAVSSDGCPEAEAGDDVLGIAETNVVLGSESTGCTVQDIPPWTVFFGCAVRGDDPTDVTLPMYVKTEDSGQRFGHMLIWIEENPKFITLLDAKPSYPCGPCSQVTERDFRWFFHKWKSFPRGVIDDKLGGDNQLLFDPDVVYLGDIRVKVNRRAPGSETSDSDEPWFLPHVMHIAIYERGVESIRLSLLQPAAVAKWGEYSAEWR